MLNISALTAGYGGVPVLHGIDIAIQQGEAVAVIGANGAGKSTLVRTLCGLNSLMGGAIQMRNANIGTVPAHLRMAHGIAAVLENRNLFTELTVRENLILALHFGQKHRAGAMRFSLDDIYKLFPVVSERRDTQISLLSGGQQQMVAIARALLLQPDLLIMDELTTGLAPKIVKEILEILRNLKTRGMSILLVEQSIAVAAEMTERAYVLSVGKVFHEIKQGEWPAIMADERLIKAYLHG